MSATRLVHVTTHDPAGGILSDGLRDDRGTFATGRDWTGVWLTDPPAALAAPDGRPEPTPAIVLDPSAAPLAPFEWLVGGANRNRWLVPAEWLDAHAARSVP